MGVDEYLKEARKLYEKALEELKRAERDKDGMLLRDACGKGWLSTMEATHGLLVKKGIKEEELPRTDRGRRYMVFKYAERELELLYKTLRNDLHVEGYYDGSLGFDEVERRLNDLGLYIQEVEKLEFLTKPGPVKEGSDSDCNSKDELI